MSAQELDVAALFRELFLADLEASGDRGLASYQLLFPGHDEEISELHQRMSLAEEGSVTDSRSMIGLDTSPGALVAHYRIEGEIGRGGQAVVHRAHDEKLGRSVALKLLLGAAQRGEAGLRRFRREAEVCSRLDHPGICTVHDTGIQGGIPYIVMELVEGEGLTDWARGQAGSEANEASEFLFSDDLPEGTEAPDLASASSPVGERPDRKRIEEIIETFARAAEALDAAHEAGVIHRDIKPGNILVKGNGQPVLLDFGLAQDDDSALHALTQTGDFFGTPAYMSPEQISAHRIRLDSRSDIFSLGVSLFECLGGIRPFDAPTREGIYQAILTKESPDLKGLNSAVSRDLAVVVGKAIEKDRDRRYQRAGDLAKDLRRVLHYEPILAKPAGPGVRLLRWTQRNRVLAAALIALPLVVAVTLVTASIIEKSREADQETEALRGHRQDLESDLDELAELLAKKELAIILQPRLLRRIGTHLAALGDSGLDLVRSRLDDQSGQQRLAGVLVLIHAGDNGSVETLARLCIEDEQAGVRAWSSQALLRMEGPDVDEALLRVVREAEDESPQVNAIFGLVFNKHPDSAELAKAYVHDDGRPLFMRFALARNLMYLARSELTPLATWLLDNLQPVQGEDWASLIHHHKQLGGEANLEILNRIAADERLERKTRESAEKAAAKILEEQGLDSAD